MSTDYCELIRNLAKNHIHEFGEFPLENASCGMYNLDLYIPNGIDERLNSKYDVIVQCYPNGEFEQVFLLVYYDVNLTFGSVDNNCYCLTDFSEDMQKQIYELYNNALNN